jgi:hypothetical protein
MHTPHLLDVDVLLSYLPAQGLLRSQVGTVVELLDGVCEVEFRMTRERHTLSWRSHSISCWFFITAQSERHSRLAPPAAIPVSCRVRICANRVVASVAC